MENDTTNIKTTKRRRLEVGTYLAHCICMLLLLAPTVCQGQLQSLDLFTQGHPRALFFRQAESGSSNYNTWEDKYSRLGGIIGKTLDEEIPGRSSNIPAFTRFKREHPEQLVLIHYNGNARDPRDLTPDFFAGHWIYDAGCKVTSNVPAQTGNTVIQVENADLFRTNIGRSNNKNDEICLCELDASGKPDWHRCEQVVLVSKDGGSITVKRAQYGSKPRAFEAGRVWAARHRTEGPWGGRSNLMWFYNFSTECPRNSKGQNLIDVLVDDLARRFRPGGALAAYDGLEFDVLHFKRGGAMDADGDGKMDDGVIGGVNTYGLGVTQFCQRLRTAIGPDKLLMADGYGGGHQRGYGTLNGIESEGFPSGKDPEIKDWSGGLNRLLFWNRNAQTPAFNYINFKYFKGVESPGMNIARLVFAAATLTDAAICGKSAPSSEIWDEWVKGAEDRQYWLGRPCAPPVHLALSRPDLLRGEGKQVTQGFLDRWSGGDVRFQKEGEALKISGTPGRNMGFSFQTPCEGPDLLISFMVRCEPMPEYPVSVGRLLKVEHMMTQSNGEWFPATFYFRDIQSDQLNVEFTMESSQPMWLSDFTVHAHPDAMARVFKNGVVLANPAHHDYTFNLAEVLPQDLPLFRIQGTSKQDQRVNNGQAVGKTITLGQRDAIFLSCGPHARFPVSVSPAMNFRDGP